MTAALLGAEHDLRAVLAVGVFIATVGIGRRATCTSVLFGPELEILFGAKEVQTVTIATVATLVFADRVVRATEHDNGNRTSRVALGAVRGVQVHGSRGNRGVDIGHEAGHVVAHAATHREAGCVHALLVDAGDFFDSSDHFARELDVVIVGAAGTHVPARAHLASVRGLGAIGVQRDYAFFFRKGPVLRIVELTGAAAHNRVVVYKQRNRLVTLVGIRDVHDEGALLAVDRHAHVLLAGLGRLAGTIYRTVI